MGKKPSGVSQKMAGPLIFSAAVAVPLVWGGEFEIVKASGPHPKGPQWKVELFQANPGDVGKAIKNFLDGEVGKGIGKGVKAVGKGIEKGGELLGKGLGKIFDW